MDHEEAQTIMRHFDVVAEGLSKDILRVAEGHGILVEKIDGLGVRMDRIEVRMDSIEVRMDSIEVRMDRLEIKLDGFMVETRTNFDELRAAIKFSYAELDRRVGHLESAVLDLADRVQRIEARQPA